MENRTLVIMGMAAKGLNRVNLIGKMDVYVVVTIDGSKEEDKQKKKTPVHKDGDTSPYWTVPMNFTINDFAARLDKLTIVFKIRCEMVLGDKLIGEVRLPIKQLLDSTAATGGGGGGGGGKEVFKTCEIMKPNGVPKGEFTFSYKFDTQGNQAAVAQPADSIAGLAMKLGRAGLTFLGFGASSAPPMPKTSSVRRKTKTSPARSKTQTSLARPRPRVG